VDSTVLISPSGIYSTDNGHSTEKKGPSVLAVSRTWDVQTNKNLLAAKRRLVLEIRTEVSSSLVDVCHQFPFTDCGHETRMCCEEKRNLKAGGEILPQERVRFCSNFNREPRTFAGPICIQIEAFM
jgi:hypothetical protein